MTKKTEGRQKPTTAPAAAMTKRASRRSISRDKGTVSVRNRGRTTRTRQQRIDAFAKKVNDPKVESTKEKKMTDTEKRAKALESLAREETIQFQQEEIDPDNATEQQTKTTKTPHDEPEQQDQGTRKRSPEPRKDKEQQDTDKEQRSPAKKAMRFSTTTYLVTLQVNIVANLYKMRKEEACKAVDRFLSYVRGVEKKKIAQVPIHNTEGAEVEKGLS